MKKEDLKFFQDTFMRSPFRMVSTRMKRAIEHFDPDGSIFYPFTFMEHEGGEIIEPGYWYWLPRHRLAYKTKGRHTGGPRVVGGHWGYLSDPEIYGSLIHEPKLQDHIATRAVWGMATRRDEVLLRPDLYHHLGNMGATGLTEAPENMSNRLTGLHTVGRVYYIRQGSPKR